MSEIHIIQMCKYGYIHKQCSCKGSRHIVMIICQSNIHKRKPKTEEQ